MPHTHYHTNIIYVKVCVCLLPLDSQTGGLIAHRIDTYLTFFYPTYLNYGSIFAAIADIQASEIKGQPSRNVSKRNCFNVAIKIRKKRSDHL